MITVFGQVGDLIDKALNWFIGLSPIWQFLTFAVVIGLMFYIMYIRSNN